MGFMSQDLFLANICCVQVEALWSAVKWMEDRMQAIDVQRNGELQHACRVAAQNAAQVAKHQGTLRNILMLLLSSSESGPRAHPGRQNPRSTPQGMAAQLLAKSLCSYVYRRAA